MAIYNPLYNEETGWTPLDQLEPWQQALMNPGARGMSMPGYDQNLMSMLGGQNAGVNPGAGTGGSMMSPDPYTWTGPPNSGAGNSAFNNVFNSGTTPRPSQAAPVIGSPQLATNMSMTGAENVGGMGMYTGSNGPLDTTRFTPVQGQQQNGPPPGSIPTGDPNTWITPQGNTWNTPGSINNRTQAEYDAYRQRAYGDIMGPQGRGPQSNPYSELSDVLRQAPGSINAQTFQGYLGSLQGQQTGPYPPQQTAPRPPQNQTNGMAPSGGYQPSNFAGLGPYGGFPGIDPREMLQQMRPGQPGQTPMQNFPGYNPQPLPGAFPMGDPRETWGGMYDAQYGQGAYQRMQEQERARQDEMLASVGLRRQRQGDAGFGQQRFSDLRSDPLGIGVDIRDVVAANGSPVNWDQLTQQYGANKFGGNKMFQPQPQPSYGQNPYQMQQSPVIGSPGMINQQQQWYPGVEGQRQYINPTVNYDPNYDPSKAIQRTGSRMWGGQIVDESAAEAYMQQRYAQQQQGVQQPSYQQMVAQFSSDPATQAAYLSDMLSQSAYGAGYNPQQQYLTPNGLQGLGGQSQPDFRAATFGGGSLFHASAGGSGNTNIPNTTNPSTSQYSTPGWGGASNRRGGFGGMSLFGNQFGSGGSTGFGGTQSSQYRGAGSYGRPASYGQSQRPY